MADTDKLWYFAFGSNMNPKVLSGRRNVHPTQSKPCYIPGWYLNFDTTAIPYREPSFGSIGTNRLPDDPIQPEVHGVVHEITRKDYEQIRRTEGGGGHENIGYGSVQVRVQTYDGEDVPAFTLVEHPRPVWHGTFYPSKRYMELLETGAAEFGLKPEYQQWLKTVPRYSPINSNRHLIGRKIFLALVYLCQYLVQLPWKVRARTGRRAPRWTFVVARYSIITFGHIYYFVFRPLFGPGAGEDMVLSKSSNSSKKKLK